MGVFYTPFIQISKTLEVEDRSALKLLYEGILQVASLWCLPFSSALGPAQGSDFDSSALWDFLLLRSQAARPYQASNNILAVLLFQVASPRLLSALFASHLPQ